MSSARRLVSSIELVRRVNEAALAYTLTRMKVLERFPAIRSVSPIVRSTARQL